MSHHLEPVGGPSAPAPDLFDDEAWDQPLRRPAGWRWVAIVVALAMVVATPFAYALYRVFH